MSDGCSPASRRAAATASSTSSRELRSRCLPNRVIAAPATKTSAMAVTSAQRRRRQGDAVVDQEAADGVARRPPAVVGLEYLDERHHLAPALEADPRPFRRRP